MLEDGSEEYVVHGNASINFLFRWILWQFVVLQPFRKFLLPYFDKFFFVRQPLEELHADCFKGRIETNWLPCPCSKFLINFSHFPISDIRALLPNHFLNIHVDFLEELRSIIVLEGTCIDTWEVKSWKLDFHFVIFIAKRDFNYLSKFFQKSFYTIILMKNKTERVSVNDRNYQSSKVSEYFGSDHLSTVVYRWFSNLTWPFFLEFSIYFTQKYY